MQRLPSNHEIIVYRIIQELIHNAVKHSKASQIIVQFSKFESMVNLVVEDNGSGFNTSLWNQSTGMGFHNIQNRVEYLGGNIRVHSDEKEGTSFLIEYKLPK